MQENDFKHRHDSNSHAILTLKKEMDDLRFLLNEKSRHNNDVQVELTSNREQINRKEVDITATQRELSHKSDH